MGRIKMLTALVRWSFALALCCTVSWAQAAVITYTFQAVFDDGGTIHGWARGDLAKPVPPFYDPGIDYEVITTKGSLPIEPGEYNNNFPYPPSQPIGDSPLTIFVHLGTSHDLFVYINFRHINGRDDFTTPLSVEGGEDTLFWESYPSSVQRHFFSTDVFSDAVPEPNTYAMILAGLVLIGAISATARR
jgi:PEP-CTERM motif